MMSTRPLPRNHEGLIGANKHLKKTIAKQEATLRKDPFAPAMVGPSEPSQVWATRIIHRPVNPRSPRYLENGDGFSDAWQQARYSGLRR